MSDRLARILAGVSVIGMVLMGAWVWRLNGRIASLHERLGEVREQRLTNAKFLQGLAENAEDPATEVTRRKLRTKAKTKGKAKAKAGKARLPVDEREERRMARQEERRVKFREAMTTEIDAFADEQGIDPVTSDEVLEELLLLREAGALIREDMREGRLTNFEGRTELHAMREDSDARVQEILGTELAEALMARLGEEREGRRPE
jgi:hypothetical protein